MVEEVVVIDKTGRERGGLAAPPQLARAANAESVHASFVVCNVRTLHLSTSPPIPTQRKLLNRERRSRGMLYRSQRARDRDRVIASPECLRFRYHRWAGGLEDQAGEHQTGTAQGQES